MPSHFPSRLHTGDRRTDAWADRVLRAAKVASHSASAHSGIARTMNGTVHLPFGKKTPRTPPSVGASVWDGSYNIRGHKGTFAYSAADVKEFVIANEGGNVVGFSATQSGSDTQDDPFERTFTYAYLCRVGTLHM